MEQFQVSAEELSKSVLAEVEDEHEENKMDELKVNQYKDFYWYAKGWYEKSEDVRADIIAITREYSGSLSDLVDAMSVLEHVVEQYIFEFSGNPRYNYRTLVSRLQNSDTEKWIETHLSLLRFAEIRDNAGNIVIDMGLPSGCLSLTDSYYEKIDEEQNSA